MSVAAADIVRSPAFSALPPGIPATALRHLGISAAQILALEVLGVTFLDAVGHGIIKLPPPLTLEALPDYLETIREWTAMGLDPNDAGSTISQEQAIAEGLLPKTE